MAKVRNVTEAQQLNMAKARVKRHLGKPMKRGYTIPLAVWGPMKKAATNKTG